MTTMLSMSSAAVLVCGLVLCVVLGNAIWQRGTNNVRSGESIRIPFNRLRNQVGHPMKDDPTPWGGSLAQPSTTIRVPHVQPNSLPPDPISTSTMPTTPTLSTSATPKVDPTQSSIPVTSAACNGWGCTCTGLSNRFETFPNHWGKAAREPTARSWWLAHHCNTSPDPAITAASRACDDKGKTSSHGGSSFGVNVCGAKVQKWNQSAASCLNLPDTSPQSQSSSATGHAAGPNATVPDTDRRYPLHLTEHLAKVLVSNRETFCTCPWPVDWGPQWGAAPGGWVNFTVDTARELLRGKTIVLGGDSTSRRLMHTLCKFLAGDLSNSDRSGEGCCGTSRQDVYCLVPALSRKHDILLLCKPALVYPDITKWISVLGNAALHREGRHINWHGSHMQRYDTMPPSKTPRAIHIFAPAAASAHADNSCLRMLPGRWGDQEGNCSGAEEYVSVPSVLKQLRLAPNTTESAVCALTAAFCARFTESAAAVRRGAGLPSATAFYGHGFSNMLAAPGMLIRDKRNDWQWMVGRSLGRHTREEVCGSTGFGAFPKAADAIYCGGVDQATWMSAPGLPLTRHPCMPGEGWQGIHVYNEYAMLMRAQLVLNSIHSAEVQMPLNHGGTAT